MSDLSAEVHDEYGSSIQLPDRIGLCPIHGQEFYMPLLTGDSETCPECPAKLVVYARKDWS